MKLKRKSRFYFIYFLCSFLLLSPPLFFIVYSILTGTSVIVAGICFAVDILVLGIIYNAILRPIMRLNDTVFAVLEASDAQQLSAGDASLMERFQALIDREYDTRMAFHQATLDALQNQINPHFLYNTLECIRGQAVVEKAYGISDMAKALSEFFRYSISLKERLVHFSDEKKNVMAFIKIQNYRFNNKYQIDFHTDASDSALIDRCEIPRLTLQPIVENALVHGVRNSERDKEIIDIHTELTQSRLIIQITDHGVGIPQEKLDTINSVLSGSAEQSEPTIPHSGTGIGLQNINERIQLLFGSSYGLRVYSTLSMGCTVEIVLPRKIQ